MQPTYSNLTLLVDVHLRIVPVSYGIELSLEVDKKTWFKQIVM